MALDEREATKPTTARTVAFCADRRHSEVLSRIEGLLIEVDLVEVGKVVFTAHQGRCGWLAELSVFVPHEKSDEGESTEFEILPAFGQFIVDTILGELQRQGPLRRAITQMQIEGDIPRG